KRVNNILRSLIKFAKEMENNSPEILSKWLLKQVIKNDLPYLKMA
ncbi:hypothetical protein SASC598J21_000460, partial [Snodgrassella alvi SCGC AB-598-J21]